MRTSVVLLTASLMGVLFGDEVGAAVAAESIVPVVTAHNTNKTLTEPSAVEPHALTWNARPALVAGVRQGGFHHNGQATPRSEGRAVTRELEPGRADRSKGAAPRNTGGQPADHDLSWRPRVRSPAPIRTGGPDAYMSNATTVRKVNGPVVGAVPPGHGVTRAANVSAGGVFGRRQRPPALATLGGPATTRAGGSVSLSGNGPHRRL